MQEGTELELIKAAEIIAQSITDASMPRGIEYISLFISAVGIVFSGIAIWTAVLVPKKIAEQQNKITLFEKRFEFYDILCRCINFSTMIRNIQTNREIRLFFIASFGREIMNDTAKEALEREEARLTWQAMTILEQGKYLFDFETEEWIEPLVSALVVIGSISETHERFWDYYGDFKNAVKNMEENLLPQVKEALQLGKMKNK